MCCGSIASRSSIASIASIQLTCCGSKASCGSKALRAILQDLVTKAKYHYIEYIE